MTMRKIDLVKYDNSAVIISDPVEANNLAQTVKECFKKEDISFKNSTAVLWNVHYFPVTSEFRDKYTGYVVVMVVYYEAEDITASIPVNRDMRKKMKKYTETLEN